MQRDGTRIRYLMPLDTGIMAHLAISHLMEILLHMLVAQSNIRILMLIHIKEGIINNSMGSSSSITNRNLVDTLIEIINKRNLKTSSIRRSMED
jgi:hypothetical protein